MRNLLTPDEPASYTLINAHVHSPLVIACDHASARIPRRLADLGLSAAQLQQHIASDLGAAAVATRLAQCLHAPLLLANYSRLVIDLNRHPDTADSIPTTSDQIPIRGNHNLSHAHKAQRLSEIFQPYHARYAALVTRAQAHCAQAHSAQPLLLALHSFTPSLQGVRRPWHYGILHQQDALGRILLQGFRRIAGRVIGDNQPYHANHPRGYALEKHAVQRGVDIALIEIRQDIIATAAGQQTAAAEIAQVIEPLLDCRK